LAATSVCLLILHYSKYSRNIALFLSDSAMASLRSSAWYELSAYLWWTSMHLLTFVLLPWLIIRLCLREKMRDFGWRVNEAALHWRGYLLLLSPILVFVVLVSFGQDFVNHYPFYELAGRS